MIIIDWFGGYSIRSRHCVRILVLKRAPASTLKVQHEYTGKSERCTSIDAPIDTDSTAETRSYSVKRLAAPEILNHEPKNIADHRKVHFDRAPFDSTSNSDNYFPTVGPLSFLVYADEFCTLIPFSLS